jgi:hypothetical protein
LPSTLTVTNPLDSGVGSLRATIAAASNGDTIVFNDRLEGQTIRLTSGELTVNKSLNIVGLGEDDLTVSGNDVSRVFHVTSGVTVSLSALTIAHGHASIGGGLDNAGNLTIRDSVLADNQSVGGAGGGAILNEVGATLSLGHSVLANNTATAGSGLDVFGGGLLNDGQATIESSAFHGNKAVGGAAFTFFGGSVGGAIDNFGGATLTVAGSTFIGNQAISAAGPFAGIGGAIENNAGFDTRQPSTATIRTSTFINNLATGGTGSTANGGALDNEGPGVLMTVTDSALIHNRAVGGPGGDGVTTLSQAIGGGILNAFGTLIMRQCSLMDNEAVGGSNGSNVPASASEGVGSGGGLANALSLATVTESTFIGNQAIGGDSAAGIGGIAQGGGSINFLGGTLILTTSAFVANTARAGRGASGAVGGLAAGGGFDNYAGSGVSGTMTVATIAGTTFRDNQALGGTGGAGAAGGLGIGGAIAVGQDVLFGAPDSPTLTLSGDAFFSNLAQGGTGGSNGTGGGGWGGAVGIVSGTASDTGGTFSNNSAIGGTGGTGGNGLGGGLFNNTGATLTLAGSTVTQNMALGGEEGTGGSDGQGIGGGIYNFGTFSFDAATIIALNQASTSNDNIFG